MLSGKERHVVEADDTVAVAELRLGGLQRERLDRVAVGLDAAVVLDSVNGVAELYACERERCTTLRDALVGGDPRSDVRSDDIDARADVALGTVLV